MLNNTVDKFIDKHSQEKVIEWFKKVCVIEAWTCFFLYLVAMPLKRYYPEANFALIFIIIVGNIHGLFFTLYLLLTLPARKIFSWDDEDFVFSILAAFFPFATIWIDRKLARFDREE